MPSWGEMNKERFIAKYLDLSYLSFNPIESITNIKQPTLSCSNVSHKDGNLNQKRDEKKTQKR